MGKEEGKTSARVTVISNTNSQAGIGMTFNQDTTSYGASF